MCMFCLNARQFFYIFFPKRFILWRVHHWCSYCINCAKILRTPRALILRATFFLFFLQRFFLWRMHHCCSYCMNCAEVLGTAGELRTRERTRERTGGLTDGRLLLSFTRYCNCKKRL